LIILVVGTVRVMFTIYGMMRSASGRVLRSAEGMILDVGTGAVEEPTCPLPPQGPAQHPSTNADSSIDHASNVNAAGSSLDIVNRMLQTPAVVAGAAGLGYASAMDARANASDGVAIAANEASQEISSQEGVRSVTNGSDDKGVIPTTHVLDDAVEREAVQERSVTEGVHYDRANGKGTIFE